MEEKLWWNMLLVWTFGLSGIALMFIGYWVFDKLTPRIDFAKELVDKANIAVGIMIGSLLLGIAIIVAAVMVGGS